MALILNLETATHACSVALALHGKCIALQEDVAGQSHARLLTTLIANSLEAGGYRLSDLDAVAVSRGPGSFTGLRIGVATAKGICYALDKPLVSVNTLQSMASVLLSRRQVEPGTWLCPMIDARRMEVYTAFYDHENREMQPTSAEIITHGCFNHILDMQKVIFFGDGMPKTRHLIDNHPNAFFVADLVPSATGMVPFTENSYHSGLFEDIAYFEPFYLKDFFTGGQPFRVPDRRY